LSFHITLWQAKRFQVTDISTTDTILLMSSSDLFYYCVLRHGAGRISNYRASVIGLFVDDEQQRI